MPQGGGEELGAGEIAGAAGGVHPQQPTVRPVQQTQHPLDGAVGELEVTAEDEHGVGVVQGGHEGRGRVGGIAAHTDEMRVAAGHVDTLVMDSVGPVSTPPPVLAAEDTPVGRIPGPDRDRRAHLALSGEGWTLTSPWRRAARGSWSRPEALLDRLGRLDLVHSLTIDAEPTGPAPDAATTTALATFVTRAIARGTFVVGDLPAMVSRRVHAEVPGAAHQRAGDLAFDIAAVRQRRQVLSTRLTDPPTVSILLATRRPHLLAEVAAMIRAQTHRRVEVVVAVHGGDPEHLPTPDVGAFDLRVLAVPGDRSLGHALQLAAEAASGELLTKMDDDDHYGPDHLVDLLLARDVSGAPVVGKSSTVVHVEALDTTVRRVIGVPETPVHRVAGGTILVGADELRSFGGWADVPRAVDSALMRAATDAGAMIYRPHDIGYLYVRHAAADGHTWSADAGHFLANSREQWLGLLRHPDFGT